MASIDTVHFTLENLHRYPMLHARLTKKSTFGVSKETYYTPNPNWLPIDVINTTRLGQITRQKKSFEYISYKASHHYSIAVTLDESRNKAMFNLSLPKFMYGHNVKMLYNNPPPPRPGNAIKQGYSAFIHAMSAVLYEFLHDTPFWDIRIDRIDYCMNCEFISEEAAFRKLNDFKSNKKAYQRISAPVYNAYESDKFSDMCSTVFIKCNSHSFKIYQKGEEFRKHDYKKVLKSMGRDVADNLQRIANRTLRFEATFRHSYMSYLFHRATVPEFLKGFLDHGDTETHVRILKDNLYSDVPGTGLNVYQTILNAGFRMDGWYAEQSIKKVAKKIHAKLKQMPAFRMQGNNNYNTFRFVERNAVFDYFVFELLARRFQTFIDDMTINIDTLPDECPDYVKRYSFLSKSHTDYELLNQRIYKSAQVIANLRHLLKKWSRIKHGKDSICNMETALRSFDYAFGGARIFDKGNQGAGFYDVPDGMGFYDGPKL